MPKAWLQDCTITYLSDGPASNADVYQLAIDREFDVRRCNLDKAAIRKWAEAHPKVRMKN